MVIPLADWVTPESGHMFLEYLVVSGRRQSHMPGPQAGAKPVLLSPFRFAGEVKRVASRHGVEYFTLPTEPEAFARIVMTAG